MITRRMEDTFKELKSSFNTRFNAQEEDLTKTFDNIIADLKKEITKEIENEDLKQCKEFYSEKKCQEKKSKKTSGSVARIEY